MTQDSDDYLLNSEEQRQLNYMLHNYQSREFVDGAYKLSTILHSSVEYDTREIPFENSKLEAHGDIRGYIQADEDSDPSEQISKNQVLDDLGAEIHKLKPQHQQIMSWYFGLSNTEQRGPLEISKDLGYKAPISITRIVRASVVKIRAGMQRRGHLI